MLISTRESAPSCHNEEACSRVRHGCNEIKCEYRKEAAIFKIPREKFRFEAKERRLIKYMSRKHLPGIN